MADANGDREALRAVGDKLADASDIHAMAADAADSPALRHRLDGFAEEREAMSRAMLAAIADHDGTPGTALAVLDKLRLAVDRMFDAGDQAALDNARRADADVASMIEDLLADPELAAQTREMLLQAQAALPDDLPRRPGLRDMVRDV